MLLDLPQPLRVARRPAGDERTRGWHHSGERGIPGSPAFGERPDGELDAWHGLKCEVLACAGVHERRDYRLQESLLLLHKLGGCACIVTVGHGEQRYTVKSGAFDFFPAGTYRHVLIGPLPVRAIAVHIPAGFEYAVLEERGETGALPVQWQFSDRRLSTMVEGLLQVGERDKHSPGAVMRSVGIVDRLFDILNGHSGSDGIGFSAVMGRLVGEYVDYRAPAGVKLDDLASIMGLGRAQFARGFKDAFGLPLHGHLLARRVELAKAQLRGSRRITQIAHDLGFASHAHFTTTFRKLTGMTPSAFRDSTRDMPSG